MKLGILYTGGTIGCFGDPLSPLTTEDFERLFEQHVTPALKARFDDLELKYIRFGPPTLDSTNLAPLDWCTLVELLLPHYHECGGFVILHGTDTMAYTASALSFLFTGLDENGFPNALLSQPIVVTGSQVPIFYGKEPESAVLRFDTDAFQNVCGAVAAAQTNVPEVSLFFNHKLMRGNRTCKTSANEFDAFASPNYAPLAQAGIGFTLDHRSVLPMPHSTQVSLDSPQAMDRLKEQLQVMKKHISSARVTPFISFPTAVYPRNGSQSNYLADQLESILHLDDSELRLKALILESYGEGNFPSGDPNDPTKGCIYKVLSMATKAGVIIVDNTQVLGGVVDPNAYASGSWMSDDNINAVGAYDMTPICMYTKLMYLLSLGEHYGWDSNTVRRLVTRNICGEMMDVHVLNTQGKYFLSPGESITSVDGTARLMNVPQVGPELVLKDLKTGEWGAPVWSPLGDASKGLTEQHLAAGRLYMEGSGNLALRSYSNVALWESGTSGQNHSRLVLLGQKEPEGPMLCLYNYEKHQVVKKLYPEERGNKRQRTK